jgi:hypothetical protein
MSLNSTQGFERCAEQYQAQFRHASKWQDMLEHWDYRINYKGNRYRVELKGLKKISSTDKDVQDMLAWIEFTNVNGFKGWLYGKADLICFERFYRFDFFWRKDLIERAEQLCDFKTFVDLPSLAYRKMYRREGRQDVLSLLKFSELGKTSFRWNKK